MGDNSAIAWTDATWNPLLGCSRVSEGCRHCYAEGVAHRNAAMGVRGYAGLTKKVGSEARWTGQITFVPEALALPLRWKRPRRIFVNSMSDLFHEDARGEWISAIWGVMMLAEGHIFQVLTKRPERMREWLIGMHPLRCIELASRFLRGSYPQFEHFTFGGKHIQLGVSVEDQKTADERIEILLDTPAHTRWVSYEPALGPVDFKPYLTSHVRPCPGGCTLHDHSILGPVPYRFVPYLNWIVVGGESGHGARQFDLAWARQTIAQCREARCPVFVKQLGAHVKDLVGLTGKGTNPAQWPEDLRVQEYPK